VALTHLKKPPVALGFSTDGIDDYIKAGEGAFLYGLDEVMIATWVYIYSQQAIETFRKSHIYARWVPGIFWRGFLIGGEFSIVQTFFSSVIFFVNEATGEFRSFSADCYELDRWVHVVFGYSKLVEKGWIYFNAELALEADITGWHAEGFLGPLDDSLMDGFWLGSNPGGGENYKLITNETYIYDRILSLAEITDLFNIRRNIMEGSVLKLGTLGLVRGTGTQWLDESPYKNHGTVYGAKRCRLCHCNIVRNYGT